MITPQPNGDYLIVIMDCTRDVAAVRTFMRYSLWFGVGCIILYVVILAALCNLAIKPLSAIWKTKSGLLPTPATS